MSHQVALSNIVFNGLETLKEIVEQEGLEITDYMDGYGYESHWTVGQNYGDAGQKLAFGIKLPDGQAKCGFAENANGTFSFIGDAWNQSYGGYKGFREMGSHFDQRYRIVNGVRDMLEYGLDVTDIPETLGHCDDSGYISVWAKFPETTQTVTTL